MHAKHSLQHFVTSFRISRIQYTFVVIHWRHTLAHITSLIRSILKRCKTYYRFFRICRYRLRILPYKRINLSSYTYGLRWNKLIWNWMNWFALTSWNVSSVNWCHCDFRRDNLSAQIGSLGSISLEVNFSMLTLAFVISMNFKTYQVVRYISLQNLVHLVVLIFTFVSKNNTNEFWT